MTLEENVIVIIIKMKLNIDDFLKESEKCVLLLDKPTLLV